MEEKTKTIGISSLIALALITISMVTPTFFDEPKYFCDARPEVGIVSCDNFSKYIADNGKCIRNDDTNLICREGWLLVTDDTILPEEQPREPSYDNVGEKWICKPDNGGCEAI